MRRLLLAVLSCLFMFSITAFAADTTAAGTSNDEDKNIIMVEGVLIEDVSYPMARNLGGQKHIRTYMYEIETASDESHTTSDWDDASVCKAYLTIEYSSYDDANGQPLYVLDRVSGRWTEPTDSAYIVSSKVTYGCTKVEDGSQIGERFVSNNFSFPTNFDEGVSNWGGGTLGANLYLDLQRGSSSEWTLHLQNLAFGAGF